MNNRYKPVLWTKTPNQSVISRQATANIQRQKGWEEMKRQIQMAGWATNSSCPNTGLETKSDVFPTTQITPSRTASLPGIAICQRPSKKQNIKLPPIRTIFGDLLGARWSSQEQPWHIARSVKNGASFNNRQVTLAPSSKN